MFTESSYWKEDVHLLCNNNRNKDANATAAASACLCLMVKGPIWSCVTLPLRLLKSQQSETSVT